MAIIVYPIDGPTYSGDDAQTYLCTRTSGVYSADDSFAATALGGRQVQIGAGLAWMKDTEFGGKSVCMKEATTLTLPMADGTRPRLDRIVLRFDAAAAAASVVCITGTAATSPAAPAIQRSGGIYDLGLCLVERPAGSTEVTVAHIQDTRLDESVCGVMRDGVTTIPTATLQAEARAKVEGLEESATASAAAAANSQTAAASSASAAASSQQAAASSASAAAQFASDAHTDASAANDSQQAAASSASAAASSETNAAASARSAAASAEAAAGSAEAAAASASQADAVVQEAAAALALVLMPVGYIYTSTDSTSPASLFGGTWEQIKDRFLLAAGDSYAAGETGGEAEHQLIIDETPRHTHAGYRYQDGSGANTGTFRGQIKSSALAWTTIEPTASISPLVELVGDDQPHNNMPPYLVVYCWKRIA